jgi:hypothetical protein
MLRTTQELAAALVSQHSRRCFIATSPGGKGLVHGGLPAGAAAAISGDVASSPDYKEHAGVFIEALPHSEFGAL